MDYKKVLKLHHINNLSSREIASSCNCSKTTINNFLRRFRDCLELSYPLLQIAIENGQQGHNQRTL